MSNSYSSCSPKVRRAPHESQIEICTWASIVELNVALNICFALLGQVHFIIRLNRSVGPRARLGSRCGIEMLLP